MWEKQGKILRILGSILVIVALTALTQPLQSQMVNKQKRMKSSVTLLWLFNEVSSIDYFFNVKESLYEPSLMLEQWMLDPDSYLIPEDSYEALLYNDVFYEPEMELEEWMVEMKCFCKNLPEKFCDEILELEDWMCCPFKIR